jgi:uncharacterized protein YndB with AHSA1/START domain
MQNEIKQVWHFEHPPEEVWDYLTRADRLEQWLGKADIKPVAGHKFRLIGPKGSVVDCVMLEVKPCTLLSYSWQRPSFKDNTPSNSTVTWTLTPNDGGTALQLVHSGLTNEEDFTAHNEGWTIIGERWTKMVNA